MNQILITKFKSTKQEKFFKFLFILSVLVMFAIISFIAIYYYSANKKENLSRLLADNYKINQLYANSKTYDNSIFGMIKIPKIDISYVIFSELTEESLKISPCKVYGNFPNRKGNLCIAGHNYDNNLFFSNLKILNSNDKIYIYDSNNKEYIYTVFNIYQVKSDDLSPIFDYNKNEKILTLITCNNLNDNRIIVRAKQK